MKVKKLSEKSTEELQKLSKIIGVISSVLFVVVLFLIFFNKKVSAIGFALLPIVVINYTNWYQIKKELKSRVPVNEDDFI